MLLLNVLSGGGVASADGELGVAGPLMMGLTGSGSGAGIRTSTSGTRGGTCADAAAPPITQPAVNTMAKRRFMIVVPIGNSRSDILVMQPTQDGHGERLPDRLHGAGDRRVFL